MAAVEGEQHALGLRMASDVIELAGYETTYLGADVPMVDLLQAVAARAPNVVGLSATMPGSIPMLERTIADIRRLDPNLIVLFGGQEPGLAGTTTERCSFEVSSSCWRRRGRPRCSGLGPGGSFGAGGSAGGPRQRSGCAARKRDGRADLSGIAAETADLARDLARQANAYKDLAYTAALCGLPNRRAFEDRAARLRDLSDTKPLAVLMMDLDGFKQVNDLEGHEAGDRILASMARAIAGGLREGDFVARLGGDEFAALLPRTNLEEAEDLAERLRASVEDAGSSASVTSSFRVAMLDDDVRRALLRADAALYEAKNSGRNMVKSR
jgi:diguanylate cyclase (GGDEF)-like protein